MLSLITRRTQTTISVIVIIALILPLWLQPAMIQAASLPVSPVSNDPLPSSTLREKPLDSLHLMANGRVSNPDDELARSALGNMSQSEQTMADPPATSSAFDPMADILSVARVQSTYAPSGLISNTIVITFQVSNASLEDALQNVVITDALTAGVTVLEPLMKMALNDNLLSIAVGDLPPAAFKSVTVTLDVGTLAPPINLDGGAHVIGILNNLTLHNWTAPARLVVTPPEGEDTLKPTVDANSLDEYVLQKAGQLHQDAAAIIASAFMRYTRQPCSHAKCVKRITVRILAVGERNLADTQIVCVHAQPCVSCLFYRPVVSFPQPSQ